jgi:hypothetical protein
VGKLYSSSSPSFAQSAVFDQPWNGFFSVEVTVARVGRCDDVLDTVASELLRVISGLGDAVVMLWMVERVDRQVDVLESFTSCSEIGQRKVCMLEL